MNMIEKVAQVIAEGVGADHPLSDIARVAIEAMREPTEGMIEAAWAEVLAEDAKGVWREMIDAALNEKGNT